MKTLVAITLFGCGLAAQAPAPQTFVPRAPSTGSQDKVPSSAPAKTGVLPVPETAPPAGAAAPHALPGKAATDAAVHAIQQTFADPDLVLFDQPAADGPLWAMGSNWKASFDARGWTFIGRPEAGAEHLEPIRFRLADVRVGDKAIAVAEATPRQEGHRVVFAHGGLVQTVEAAGRGVEQTFTFAELPARGELVLALDVGTALAGQDLGDHLAFTGDHDHVDYAQAVAVDARGERVPAATTLVDGRITIRVPAAFVERAVLPLTVDPWVTAITVHADTTDLAEPDVAWDETGQVWAVVYARYFGGSDWDCFVQRITDGNPIQYVGGLVTIDFTGDAWRLPRIANLQLYSTFLIVAQAKPANYPTSPVRISGRLMANSGNVLTGQFDIASSAVDEIHPDVGGDPCLLPRQSFFTVAWEHCYSTSDHDIYARQVDATGALRGSSPTIVQGDGLFQSWPSVSRSDGAVGNNSQRFLVVYQQTFAAGDEDIYGSLLTWDGVFVPVNGQNTFPIDTSVYNDVMPRASSPTLPAPNGQRLLMAVYERTNLDAGDVVGTCIDQTGAVQARANISTLELDGVRYAWPQHAPSVDSDGYRFAVAYHEIFNGNTQINDNDTRVSLVGVGNRRMQIEESGVALAFSQDREFNVRIASRYSGTGVHSQRYCTVNDRDRLTNTFAIDAYTYAGTPAYSGVSTRSTACGALGITESGQVALGLTDTFSLSTSTGLVGYLVGVPASTPLGFCPNCSLGVDGTAVVGSTLSLTTPVNPLFLGGTTSVQGFRFGNSGPCLNQLQLSDTVDLTVQ